VTWIYTCPDCDRDLDDDGAGLWCEACENYHEPRLFTDDDPDDERDRMIDDRDGTHA
jgi:hypothetical protein